MGDTHHRPDPQQREGRLNRRVSMFGAVVTAMAGIAGALVGALATAHSQPVIQIFGGTPAPAATVRITVSASSRPSPRPGTGTPAPGGGLQLPGGQAFARASVIIGFSGLDLDQDPPESADLQDTISDVAPGSVGAEPSVIFSYSTAEWMQPGVPSQTQCHRSERQGESGGASFDLTPYQGTGKAARFCSMTSGGRDAYVVIPGKTIAKDSPLPAVVFVWPNKLPLSPGF
jgi:hypothetical protein